MLVMLQVIILKFIIVDVVKRLMRFGHPKVLHPLTACELKILAIL